MFHVTALEICRIALPKIGHNNNNNNILRRRVTFSRVQATSAFFLQFILSSFKNSLNSLNKKSNVSVFLKCLQEGVPVSIVF